MMKDSGTIKFLPPLDVARPAAPPEAPAASAEEHQRSRLLSRQEGSPSAAMPRAKIVGAEDHEDHEEWWRDLGDDEAEQKQGKGSSTLVV